MFGVDLFVMGIVFTGMQLTGFSLLVLFYIVEGSYNIVERRMANKKEFVANDEEYQRLWGDKKHNGRHKMMMKRTNLGPGSEPVFHAFIYAPNVNKSIDLSKLS